jgi:hypothetical protein
MSSPPLALGERVGGNADEAREAWGLHLNHC